MPQTYYTAAPRQRRPLPVPPHLPRRPPLRQPLPPRRRALPTTTTPPAAPSPTPTPASPAPPPSASPTPPTSTIAPGIQLAIADVLQRIASNDIDPRRAGLLLYGLQIASLNLPKPSATPQPFVPVDDTVEDPQPRHPRAPRPHRRPRPQIRLRSPPRKVPRPQPRTRRAGIRTRRTRNRSRRPTLHPPRHSGHLRPVHP